MDETSVRAYFERAATAEPPTNTVDVARARRSGRRRLTARRAAGPGIVLGVVTAVGALFASGVLPAGATGGHRPPATSTHHRHASGVPSRFDPAAIWATFGWLPQGSSVVTPSDGMTASMSEVEASGPNGQITLMAFAAGQCALTGPFWYSQTGRHRIKPQPGAGRLHIYNTVRKRYSIGLRCNWGGTPWIPHPLIPAGHLSNGDPAYTMINLDGQPSALAWRYATGGWAVADWGGGARPAEIMTVAEHVRYRAELRILFPVKLLGMPASWQLSGVGYLVDRGRFVAQDLYMGPSQDPAGMSLHVEPAYSPACGLTGGRQQSVRFEGARGVLVSTPSRKNAILDIRTGRMLPSKARQDLCFPSLHGMNVDLGLHDQLGAAMNLLRHVRVLGPDPARWTTHPLG